MPKILLKRHWRQSPVAFHKRGTVVDLDDATAERLLRLGAGDLASAPAPVDPTPGVDDDLTDDADVSDVDEAVDPEPADEEAPRKPLKTDKLPVFQAWARHKGENPNLTLAELKAKYL